MFVTLTHCNRNCAYFAHPNRPAVLALIMMGIWLTLLFKIQGSIYKGIFGGLAGTAALDLALFLSLCKQTAAASPSVNPSPASAAPRFIKVRFQDPDTVPDTLFVGASLVDGLTKGQSNPLTLNFFLTIKYPDCLFKRQGKADSQWAETSTTRPISEFPYVVTRIFHIQALQIGYAAYGDLEDVMAHTMGLFLDGCRTPGGAISLPGTLIMPFGSTGDERRVGHCFLIFLERNDEGGYHISLVDQLGANATTNGYGQKNIREGIAKALRNRSPGGTCPIEYHYAPAHGKPIHCGLYIELDIERAITAIERGHYIHSKINSIFISVDDQLEELIALNQAIAREWLQFHSHRRPKPYDQQNANLGRELLE